MGGAPLDDELMLRAANHITAGQWLGAYDYLTLSKAMFFPVWLALLHALHLPYLISGAALWCGAALLAAFAFSTLWRKKDPVQGRVLTLEYPGFYLVNCYTPNSQDGLKRLDYRMTWEDDFRAYLLGLDAKKPVILCGDLNVAHQEIDIKNAKTNRMSAGFTDQERAKMTELLAAGFTDSFRAVHPDEVKYSWWSYRFHAREKNAGWRLSLIHI